MDNDVMRMANHYSFDLQMTPYEQWKLFCVEKCDGYEHTLAVMELGYIRMTAVAYAKKDEYAMCYDVYVKDHAEAEDWIYYDSIYDEFILGSERFEDTMKEILFQFLLERRLSYTECNFPKKYEKKPESRCVLQ